MLTIAAAGAAAAATVLAMLPATAQSAASDSTGNATATDSTASVRPLSTAQASKLSAGDKQPVIVLLKNQHPELPATAGGSGPRSRATETDQQPLINEAKQTGATDIKPFSVLNGFAAKLTPAEQRHMAADPGVRSVVPDLPIKLAQPKTQAGTAKPALTPKVPAGVCPSDPSKPQLEPEALQTTNTAFADPSKPSAQKLATGKGVKVAFIADGLDVNNPDLIRATGGRVIVDYRDFSGEGTLLGGDAREAFGDASSIAAQGRQSYDLSTFANPAAPLPKGCNIRILGVAPGASIVALKAIASNGFGSTSSVVQSIDYAVTTDHVNVINESLGANPYPDNNNDPFTLANDAAVAAGVTVVASDGDAGVTNTIGSPASDPKIISAGASTTWRLDASTVVGALPGFKGGWNNDNVSAISSAGVTQVGAKTIDMEAPGDEGWALCSTKYRAYTGCADNNGNPSPIQQFGGTSEAAPLISGAAALVIDAYGKTHGGAKPSPALVKQILTSTATDERDPADRQGNGVLNSLAAVQAAMSIHDGNGSPTAQGSGLIFDQNQLTSTVDPNTDQGFDVHVTNVGSAAQTINARGRALSTKVSDESGSVHLDGTGGQTFVDAYGYTRSYVTHTFTVPAGADHLDASIANQPKGPNPVRFWLLDPDGKLAGYTWPQGIAGFGHADVHSPKPGTWTAVIYVKQASNSFAGDVHYDFATTGWANAGSVSPSSLTLQPGQSGTVHVTEHSSDSAGDAISALELTSNSGKRYALPIVLRSLVKINGSEGDFSGTLTGGNGRPGGPAQTNSY
ncbi:MAG: S8 family serine peptidase, partial [Sciscionella sp.]|nr:S8 family serine peptidase [Sciscionella sp.]